MEDLDKIYQVEFEKTTKKIIEGFEPFKAQEKADYSEEYLKNEYLNKVYLEGRKLYYLFEGHSSHELRIKQLFYSCFTNTRSSFKTNRVSNFFKSNEYKRFIASAPKELPEENSPEYLASHRFLRSSRKQKAKYLARREANTNAPNSLNTLISKKKKPAAIPDDSNEDAPIKGKERTIYVGNTNTKGISILMQDYLLRFAGGIKVDQTSVEFIKYLHEVSAEEYNGLQLSRWKDHIYHNVNKKDNDKHLLKESLEAKRRFLQIGLDNPAFIKLIDDDIELLKEKL